MFHKQGNNAKPYSLNTVSRNKPVKRSSATSRNISSPPSASFGGTLGVASIPAAAMLTQDEI